MCGLRRISLVLKGGSRAIGGYEPCQTGNRAALSSLTDVPRGCLPGARHTVAHGRLHRLWGVWSDFVARFFYFERGVFFLYQALYRKWRPSVFSDVVGQEHITSILTSEVKNGKLSHAYLFCGPRGTGKTTCAKIIAKAANCEHPIDGSPCGVCKSCLAIENGTTTDVIEMDAASNNGVDNIRELREGVVYTPADLKYRVYIIDEVHMLSISAFNALLKTLEEPPEHVLFILATTELHKIPATVLSRCQRFDFHRVSMEAIVARLETVCAGEGFTAEGDALALIAKLSQGGMRDSLNMLEYCAGDGGTITVEKAERLLGATPQSLLSRIAEALADRDTTAALHVIDEIYMSSRDIAVFWREWIAFCRDLMLAVSTRMAGVLDEHVRAAAERFTLPGLLYLLDIFMAAEADMQRSPQNARLYAEMALIRGADASLSDENSALLARIASLEDRLMSGQLVVAPKATRQTVEEPVYEAPPMPEAPPAESEPVKEETVASKAERPIPPTVEKKTETPKATRKGFRKWQEVVRKLSPTEGLFAPFLQAAYAYEGSDGNFYLYFENKFALTLLTDDRKRVIANAVNTVGGVGYTPERIIGTVQEDVGGIREPIDDLLEMDEVKTSDEN